MRQTNPTQKSAVLSTAYSVFRACFREFWMDRPFSIADSGQRRRAKPNKPMRLKTFLINDITGKGAKQTQATYLSSFQFLTAIFGQILKKFGSAAYRSLSRIRGREYRVPTKPNKPNEANAIVVNGMAGKPAKQTQRAYPNFYQLLTAILTPIFRRFGWKRGGSLSGIRTHGPWAEGWRFEIQNLREQRASGRRAGCCLRSPPANNQT